MKIALTVTAPDLEAQIDPRFGRCPYFLIVETDTLSFEALENPNVALGGGAGIQSGQLMAEKGVQHVLTGNCGPNAYQTLSAAGIGVIVGCSGGVREVIEQYKSGRLSREAQPNVASHFGMGGTAAGSADAAPAGRGSAGFNPGMGRGGGRGMGMGRGMGRGRGGGMGRGQGMGGGLPQQQPAPMPQQASQGATQQDELAMLRQQADTIGQQMQQIHARIQQLEQQKAGTIAARVDVERCTGCRVCVDVCPTAAISVSNGTAVIDTSACNACGLCVQECPADAISLA